MAEILEKVEQQLKQIFLIDQNKQYNQQNYEYIKGYDFNQGVDLEKLLQSYEFFGIQASNFAKATEIINQMINWKLQDEPDLYKNTYISEKEAASIKCTIFLGYTSNMVSSGVREIIRFLVEHKMINCIVTTAGGIEEDFIKCLSPFIKGNFDVNDAEMRKQQLNRIGNIFVPNESYVKFEQWLIPLLNEMYEQQINNKKIWSPSSFIEFLGNKINNKESIYYWAAKNNIPVFCPALTDGAIGDILFFNSFKNKDFILDITQDIQKINLISIQAKKSGVITLGGGLIKHHILNSNIWRNGADFGVFINTAISYDASDAGATPTEAITWHYFNFINIFQFRGKLKPNSQFIKLFCESSLIFPLLVAQTFAKKIFQEKNQQKEIQ